MILFIWHGSQQVTDNAIAPVRSRYRNNKSGLADTSLAKSAREHRRQDARKQAASHIWSLVEGLPRRHHRRITFNS